MKPIATKEDSVYKQRWHYTEHHKPVSLPSDIVFVCIGTDRSTGDSLGPLVGTMLKDLGIPNVYGTLHNPVHALNLAERVAEIKRAHPKSKVVAIDAALGKSESVGYISFKQGSIKPGAGVNKDLGEVGDYSLSAVVNVGGFMEYFVLQNTRLSLVMDMADAVVSFIEDSFAMVPILQGVAK